MALASPELLNTFELAGIRLEAEAPEEIEEGVHAAFRFFFYKQGDTVVQEGRVIPDPLTFAFKFKGDWALDAAKFLKAQVIAQKKVTFRWAKRFSFEGYLLDFRFRYSQQTVTGTLSFQPVKDLDTTVIAPPYPSAAQRSLDVEDTLAKSQLSLADLYTAIHDLQALVADEFKPLADAAGFIQEATDLVASAMLTAGDILLIPYQTIAELVDSVNFAITQIPAARQAAFDKVLTPITPLLQGTADFLARAAAQAGLISLDDLETNLSNLASSLDPLPLEYTAQQGDTIEQIATYFGTVPSAVLSLNPGLSSATLQPGTKVKVPTNG